MHFPRLATILKKMARAQGKMREKYQKNAKWQKITFRGPIWVPKVAFWGFWGLVCIEKWGHFSHLGVPEMALRVPESKF